MTIQKRALMPSSNNNCNRKRLHRIQSSNHKVSLLREIRHSKQKMRMQGQTFYSKLPYKPNWSLCFLGRGPFLLRKAGYANYVRRLITCQEMNFLWMTMSGIAMNVASVFSIWTITVCFLTDVLEKTTFAILQAFYVDSS